MKKKDGVLGAIGLTIVLTVLCMAFCISAMSIELSADKWSAIAAVLLVIVTVLLVIMGEAQRRSSEKVADAQIESARQLASEQRAASAQLAREQSEFLEKMEQQKTRPYVEFIICIATSTDKPLGVYLKNYGHGPVLNMKWTFTRNQEPITETGREGLRKVVSYYNLHNKLEGFLPTYVMSASEESIFRLADDPQEPIWRGSSARRNLVAELTKLIEEMNIELTYDSIMGRTDTIKLHDGKQTKLVS